MDGGALEDLPGSVNGAVDTAIVPPTAPGDALVDESLSEGLAIFVAVDAQKDERFVGQSFHERPLVRVQFPAGASPVTPERKHDDLATVMAQLERLAVGVLALDFGGGTADR
jgi:hypothetical protein